MIKLENICRHFLVGDQIVKALDNIQLNINAGEYISIMGPSGSGKSTLLNILGLLDRPTSGDYIFENRNITQFSEDELADFRRDNIGFVFQFFHLVPRLSTAENIELPMVLAGMPPEERKAKVAEILASVGLEHRARHKPNQLSGGQRQRVAIARATVLNPRIILADEPTGNLDRHSGNEVIEVLESYLDQGITLITVTHDPDIGSRARRKIKMIDGQIHSDNT
ncbi:ABC transporter ATP-binding protein [Kaarinaea lacus]